METPTVGKVLVIAKIENADDLALVRHGNLSPDAVRSVDVHDALVDSGAAFLHLPQRLVDQLGLVRPGTRRMRTTAGVREASVYTPAQLTIQGRECVAEVVAIPDGCPVL